MFFEPPIFRGAPVPSTPELLLTSAPENKREAPMLDLDEFFNIFCLNRSLFLYFILFFRTKLLDSFDSTSVILKRFSIAASSLPHPVQQI